MRRTLTLKRDTLTELTTSDLASVNGAENLTPLIVTLPVSDCLLRTARCPLSEDTCVGGA